MGSPKTLEDFDLSEATHVLASKTYGLDQGAFTVEYAEGAFP
jgi:hypothetical protein